MRVRRVGRDAVLVECADADQVRATYAEARRRVSARDIVPAAATVLIDGLDPGELASLMDDIGTWDTAPVAEDPGTPVELPVRYDGPDLAVVARLWECDTDEVARLHMECEFVVAFCGFAPGFAYCTGLPERLWVPRRDEPRSRVPPGSVGLAGEFTGVYPTATPGGWQLVGHTDVELWRPDEEHPALLTPGTAVRFVDA